MSAAEQAVRARALEILSGDAGLGGLVHGVFDGTPPRASAPYVSVGPAEGSDWGTMDRAGRELRLTIAVVGAGATAGSNAVARVEALLAGLRGAADSWSVVSVRAVRTRLVPARDGQGWRHELVVRCRCLKV